MSRLLNIIGSKKFRLRLLSGLVLVLLAFLILRQGGKLLFCSMMAISLVGQYELYRVLKMEREPLGAVGAALLGLAFGTFLREELTELGNPGFACLFACAFGAIISQVGDLAASAIKRDHEVKDYGDLIPGHGGILDRFDSLLFTAPAIFFALFLYSQFVHH